MTVAAGNLYPSTDASFNRAEVLGMKTVFDSDIEIDTHQGIYPAELIGLRSDDKFQSTVVAELALGIDSPDATDQDGHLAVVQVRRLEDRSVRYAMIGLHVDRATGETKARDNRHIIAINSNESITLGRHSNSAQRRDEDPTLLSASTIWGLGNRFSESTSRRQAVLRQTGSRLFIDNLSSNGTPIKANLIHAETHESVHTSRASELAQQRKVMNELGEFAGRKVITRDTTVGPNGEATVDIRSWGAGAEAIVVDPRGREAFYQPLFNDFMKSVNETRAFSNQPLSEYDVLRAINESVNKHLTYDLSYVNAQSAVLRAKGTEHRKIDLGIYLADGKGVCRQMALAAAWLGAEAKVQGLLTGRMTAEVNQRRIDNAAHEWARYTDGNGEVWIIDPAQKYFDKLSQSVNRPNSWEYFRQGEKEQFMKRYAGGTAMHSEMTTEIDILLNGQEG